MLKVGLEDTPCRMVLQAWNFTGQEYKNISFPSTFQPHFFNRNIQLVRYLANNQKLLAVVHIQLESSTLYVCKAAPAVIFQ